ncbi:MAG: UPF0149 family protein [Xanthomonadaceae bacterium]|nr:UPF0149 family protein [Xanthomonadaceae bacterium]MDE2176716.1 UPF0149 family protein [Xanthomonadaceae bacterium]MDE2245405.1 UPF0149 family protein [Xanthomonadaceae bacterium]
MSSPSPSHAELAAVLARLGCAAGASDLHGSLIGYLCMGGVPQAGSLLERLEGSGVHPADAAALGVFEELIEQALAQLDDPDLGFAPLLPQAEQPLPQRAEALREWCRGLLGGLGLGGLAGDMPLSAEGREILGDFGAIAAAHFDYADDDEEDETALAEVLEFVRVGTLLLHAEFAALARGDDPLH